jgi:hypothetical protein
LALLLTVAGVIGLTSNAGSNMTRPGAAASLAAGTERAATATSFGWLSETTPPGTWRHLLLPSGLGMLSLPPGFRVVAGDPGTASAALLGPRGTYLGYLNATPREGDERLTGWAGFRLAHLRQEDDIEVHQDAEVASVRSGRTRRSCVVDDYITKVGHHPYHEVACLVVAGPVASVVVAATPSGDPAHVWRQLERAVAAYPSPSTPRSSPTTSPRTETP